MGSKGGGGGNQTTTTTSTPWDKAEIKKYLHALLGEALPGGQLASNPMPQQQVAPLNPNETAGINQSVATGQEGQGAADAALNQAEQTLSGQYLSIPQSYLDALNSGTTTEYENTIAPSELGNAASTGAFGGSADAENRALNQFGLSTALANANAGVYEQERQNQLATAEKLPAIEAGAAAPGQDILGAGGVQQQQSQTELNAAYNNASQNAQWPYELLNFLGTGVSGIGGGNSTTVGSNPYQSNPVGNALGAGLAGAGAGSMFGPWGAAIGGGVGVLGSFL